MKTKLFLIAFFGFIYLGYSQIYDAFEPNETFATSSSINLCFNYNASIGELGDTDYYSTNVTNGQTIQINIFHIPTSLILKVTVYDSSTTELNNWSGSGNIFQSYTPNSTGTLYLKVESVSNNFSEEDYLFYVGNCLDTDGDGLLDDTETNTLQTDPNDADTDDDTLLDSIEVYIYNTDPLDADSDDDGISDGDEINIYNTLPLEEDTDSDGVFDGTEVGITTPLGDTDTNAGYFIADADSGATTTNPLDSDSDGDTLLDGQEDTNKNGSTDNPKVGGTGTVGSGETDPNNSDSDSDSLTDGDEVLIHGTNPLDTDTDDGGVADNVELNLGSNPTIGNDDDADGDGFSILTGDCDDTQPNAYPGAVEVTDGIDNNCDGLIDENLALTYVPDDNFENHLETHDYIGNVVPLGDPTSMGNGIANDDYVTTSRINTVEYLYMPSLGITDLTGIEDFVAIKNLQIPSNQLTSLDVSQNTALELFYCSVNQLTSLDVSANTALIYLNCFSNQLTTLDVSTNLALQDLSCGVNQITSLDVSLSTNLNRFIAANGQLTSLNIKNGNNTNFSTFNTLSNPNLTCIEVDDAAWSTTNWTNKDATSTFVNNQGECATLSTEVFKLTDINIYPNPVKTVLNVVIKNEASFSLITINGQVVKKGKLQRGENNLNIKMLSNGLYFLQINSANGISTKKIIKQ